MAEETDNLAPLLTELAKYGVGAAGAAGANGATQAAYQAIIKNLQDRFADYGKLGPADYKEIIAQQLGPSALAGIQDDPTARIDEQAAIGQLDEIARSGGLTLADKTALNELERKLNSNVSSRSKATANQFAARGQLGSGAQMAMELDANQNAAENANQRGEGIAAQAQQRAMDAVLKKAGLSRSMSNDDYSRKLAAAQAADAIAKHNASMTMDAAKSNNVFAGQAHDDELARLRGQTGLTNSLNTALLGSGQQTANTIAGATYGGTGLINALGEGAKAIGKLKPTGSGSGGGGGGTTEDTTEPLGGTTALQGDDKDAVPDPPPNPPTDPSEWENPYDP